MKLGSRSAFILAVALGAFAFIGGTGLTVSSAWLITMASQHPPILVLGVSIVMVRFFGIFRSVARYGERVISHEAIFRKLTGIRVRLFSSFASQLKSHSDSIALQTKAVVDDVERAQEYHLRVTLPGLSAYIAGLVTIALALWIDTNLVALAIGVSLIFMALIPVSVKRWLDPLAEMIEEEEGAFAREIASAAHGMVEAEIYGYGDRYRKSLKNAAENLRKVEFTHAAISSALQLAVLLTIGSGIVGAVLIFSERDEALPIQISMAVFLFLVGFEGFTSWFPILFPAGKNRRAQRTINSLLSNHYSGKDSGAEGRELGGRIEPHSFELIARQCRPYWSERFLQPISFALQEGQVLVIEGPSGVGKSTLASALFGFAHYEGSLTIGGVEIRDLEELDRYVSGSLQQGHIFNTTLRENLRISRDDLSDSELLRVLSLLELEDIHLDEVLGEFGRSLSGGEAKRLSIARAILSDAPIVILDEPLEHLNQGLASRIERVISVEMKERTLIVITHSPWLQYARKLTLARE